MIAEEISSQNTDAFSNRINLCERGPGLYPHKPYAEDRTFFSRVHAAFPEGY
jgi:hypothetical protein